LAMRIFKDEEKLSPDYIPRRLPHRDEELKLLESFFSSVVKGASSISTRVIITGSVGTGKSALVKLFGMRAVERARKNGVDLRFLYVNCRISKTTFSILSRIVEQLKALITSRGFSNEELFHKILNYLESKNAYAIVALDEVDVLINRQEDAGRRMRFISSAGSVRKGRSLRGSPLYWLRGILRYSTY